MWHTRTCVSHCNLTGTVICVHTCVCVYIICVCVYIVLSLIYKEMKHPFLFPTMCSFWSIFLHYRAWQYMLKMTILHLSPTHNFWRVPTNTLCVREDTRKYARSSVFLSCLLSHVHSHLILVQNTTMKWRVVIAVWTHVVTVLCGILWFCMEQKT